MFSPHLRAGIEVAPFVRTEAASQQMLSGLAWSSMSELCGGGRREEREHAPDALGADSVRLVDVPDPPRNGARRSVSALPHRQVKGAGKGKGDKQVRDVQDLHGLAASSDLLRRGRDAPARRIESATVKRDVGHVADADDA